MCQQLTWKAKQSLKASTEIVILAAGWLRDCIRQMTPHWLLLLRIYKTNDAVNMDSKQKQIQMSAQGSSSADNCMAAITLGLCCQVTSTAYSTATEPCQKTEHSLRQQDISHTHTLLINGLIISKYDALGFQSDSQLA